MILAKRWWMRSSWTHCRARIDESNTLLDRLKFACYDTCEDYVNNPVHSERIWMCCDTPSTTRFETRCYPHRLSLLDIRLRFLA